MPARNRYDVHWVNTAVSDLGFVIEHIAAESVDKAAAALGRIESAAQSLMTSPLRGRIVPELDANGVRAYRELVVSPWRIIYRISGSTVHVLAVLDGHRNVEDLLLDRLLR